MINRALVSVSRLAVARRTGASGFQMVRQVHKGHEAVPPMRYMSIPQRLGVYFFICFAFLSYPTYVLMNLDNLRPKGENTLGEEALEERERRLAARQ
uniref:Uncharacterized protein n=1 Tax=Panagrolaimus sp. PS1159 TaxID=55785 RepID=A0AC35G6N9_9BILA